MANLNTGSPENVNLGESWNRVEVLSLDARLFIFENETNCCFLMRLAAPASAIDVRRITIGKELSAGRGVAEGKRHIGLVSLGSGEGGRVAPTTQGQ